MSLESISKWFSITRTVKGGACIHCIGHGHSWGQWPFHELCEKTIIFIRNVEGVMWTLIPMGSLLWKATRWLVSNVVRFIQMASANFLSNLIPLKLYFMCSTSQQILSVRFPTPSIIVEMRADHLESDHFLTFQARWLCSENVAFSPCYHFEIR